MQLARVIETSTAVAATRSRTEKVALLASALGEAASHDDDRLVEVAADYLAGTLPQRTIGVGYRSLTERPEPAQESTLSVLEVDAALTRIQGVRGPGSSAARTRAVHDLFAVATADEQRWLIGLITGELRQGASDGVLVPAIAQAAEVPEALVRRAVMLTGFAGPVARAALRPEIGTAEDALSEIGLEVGRPVRPMLTGSAPDVVEAIPGDGTGVAVDAKLDGIRIQIHLDREAEVPIRLFTRSLEEITDRLPEVSAAIDALPATKAVLDGEVIALASDGRPHPFQVTGARTASSADPQALAARTPVTTYLFDLLHLDGTDLIDQPARARWEALESLAPDLLVDRVVTNDPAEATAFFDDVLARGHEGVVVKHLDGPYAAGRRGNGWVKVKPRRTADLVVTAVEWGSGRRRGLLSNIHLAARHDESGELVMVGKTFKGMTDAILEWQTRRFLELETRRDGHVVHVRPEQVVEIAYDGVQTSRRYPGGLALRFARVLRYRDDKSADEADYLAAL